MRVKSENRKNVKNIWKMWKMKYVKCEKHSFYESNAEQNGENACKKCSKLAINTWQ